MGHGFNSCMETIPCDEALLTIKKAELGNIRYLTVNLAFCQWCYSRSALRLRNWYGDKGGDCVYQLGYTGGIVSLLCYLNSGGAIEGGFGEI
jgi:hypothetical protein